MELKQTSHQVPRGSLADGEAFNEFFLFKNVTELRPTYQIRLLTYRAMQEGKRLVVEVPKECKVHSGLRELTKKYPKNITITRT